MIVARFFTDKYLKYRAALQGGPVTGDRPCEYCGYNLRGLRWGGRCPECGAPIRYRRTVNTLAFDEMPLPLIRRFRLSCRITTVAMVGAIGALMTPIFLSVAVVEVLVVLSVSTLLWLIGSWMLTEPIDAPQAVANGLGPRSRVRRAARWLQFGWAAYALCLVQASPAGWLALLSLAAGMSGVFVLAVHLERFASWVGDEFAAKAFALTLWGTVAAAPLILIMMATRNAFGGLTILMAPFVLALGLVLLVAALLAFPVGLFALARSVEWSAFHARERYERGRRLAERIVARSPPPPPAPPPPPGAAAQPGGPAREDAPIPVENDP